MRRAAAALAACAALSAGAAEPARWYVQLDNDFFFDTDRWYSSGLRVARVTVQEGRETEVAVLHETYTPEVKRFELGVVDRAPTARLLLSIARHERSAQRLQTVEAALGVRGPAALGREVTDLLHRVFPAREIFWSRQQSNRLDARLSATRTQRLEWLDIHYGAVLGNQVAFAHAGAELRIGPRGAAMTHLLRHAPTPPWHPGDAHGWGGFLGAGVRAVALNEMLRRPYSAFGEELERRKSVSRVLVGLSWSRPGLAATVALVQESREFEGQRTPHRFGGITVHAGF